MARRTLVDMEGDTGANTKEKSCEKPPAGHRQGGGLDEETYLNKAKLIPLRPFPLTFRHHDSFTKRTNTPLIP